MRIDAHRACALVAVVILTGCAASTADTRATPNPAPATSAGSTRDSTCLTSTGSRLPVTASSPCAGFGRSYSGQDIRGTGKIELDQALSVLDPSITLSH